MSNATCLIRPYLFYAWFVIGDWDKFSRDILSREIGRRVLLSSDRPAIYLQPSSDSPEVAHVCSRLLLDETSTACLERGCGYGYECHKKGLRNNYVTVCISNNSNSSSTNSHTNNSSRSPMSGAAASPFSAKSPLAARPAT